MGCRGRGQDSDNGGRLRAPLRRGQLENPGPARWHKPPERQTVRPRCRNVGGAAGPPGRVGQTLRPVRSCPNGEETCGLSSPRKPRPRVSSGPWRARGELLTRDGEIGRAPDFGGGNQRRCGGTIGPTGAPPEGAPRPKLEKLEKRVWPCFQWGRPVSTGTCPTWTH
ncbi:hypothetical protein NDU88_003789 [Pleurodeles waltl]|uniref:Uncharacterized protein n=1 Tax=Pleurodeles waltl TaxID=8319 RepID=A0AAV7T7R4_PLEWA|nr:hypothetical protein NDU88_003789 [Pleurodeles waltl]